MNNTHEMVTALTDNETALRQFLIGRLGCAHTAADVFQKIAEKLLGQKQLPPIANPKAYLYQTARNEVVNHYRFEEKRKRYEARCATDIGETEHRNAERIAIATNRIRLLDQSLNELPLLTKKIFLLYRVDGVKQKVIAAQLGLNLSTVEKRLAIAMKHCRARLREAD